MRLTRKSFLAGSAALAATLPLGTSRAQALTLEVYYAFPAFQRFHEPVAAEFRKLRPDIGISFRAPAPNYDEGHQTILRQAVANQLPDIFFSGFHLLPELARALARRNQITFLDDFLAAEGASFAAENYGERILALGRVDGRQAGLAFNASNPICYYNEDLLKRAGVDTATLTESWDNVIAAGAKVRGLGGDISGMAYDVHGWPDGWLFEAMIMQAGGSLLNESGTAVGFDNEIGLAALRTFRRFVTEGGMRLMDWDQSRQQFGAGLTGIYFASPANLAQITGLVGGKFTLRTTTFPITDKQRGRIPTGGNAAVILARDPARARAAWEYVKFITGPLAQKIVVEMTGYLPVNLKASGPEFLGPWYEQNPNARTPILQIERAGPWGAYPGGNTVRIWRAQRDIITAVMRGEVSPEEGLRRIVEQTNAMMRAS
ncbi:MAG: ABC transporter substrate-binding protein [Elioraea sp.]|nr:ABC transporter substrate-binding protein [Elioraea sp.]